MFSCTPGSNRLGNTLDNVDDGGASSDRGRAQTPLSAEEVLYWRADIF